MEKRNDAVRKQLRGPSGRWSTPPELEQARWRASQPLDDAQNERAKRINAEIAEEERAAAADPDYYLRKRLKVSILELIHEYSKSSGPVLRSQLYKRAHVERHGRIFDQALKELLEDNKILQTESRTGIHGRMGTAYVPYVPMPEPSDEGVKPCVP